MLPTQEEQQNKRMYSITEDYELQFDNITNKGIIHITDLHSIMDDYAKWYATKVINHCAEVAKLKEVLLPTKEQYEYSKQFIINKQSILNVINEL